MAFVAQDPDAGALCLSILLDLPRGDCREVSRLWRGGRVDLLQPDGEEVKAFSRRALALLDDEERIFPRPVLLSRSASSLPS